MNIIRAAAAVAAGGLVLGAWAPAALARPQGRASAHRYTLRVVAIDRFGDRVTAEPYVIQSDGIPLSYSGQVIKVTAGRYLVGSAVETPAAQETTQLSYTLVAKQITVSRDATVTLDARAGRLLKVAFNAPGAHQVVQGAALCGGVQGRAILAAVFDDPTGTTYVAPVPKAVRLFYQSRWQSAVGTLYDLAGAAKAGSKAAPHFRDTMSRLAKVHLELRTGTNAGTQDGGLALTEGANCESGGDLLPNGAPWAATDYMQAGSWTAEVDIGARDMIWDGALRAGHSYGVNLGAAVYGPWLTDINGTLFPVVNGDDLSYFPSGFFSDPVAQGSSDCKPVIRATLTRGASVLRRRTEGACSQAMLTRKLAKSGWYGLKVTGTQATGLLSPKVTLSWNFYVKIGPKQLWGHTLPVVLTEFRPGGLDLANAAKPGAVTPLTVKIVKAAYPSSPTPRNILKTVRIEASFDGGQTWHSLALSQRGKYWTAKVHDPASGFVSLRSIVINTKGDRSVQTMYNAYAVG